MGSDLQVWAHPPFSPFQHVIGTRIYRFAVVQASCVFVDLAWPVREWSTPPAVGPKGPTTKGQLRQALRAPHGEVCTTTPPAE